MTNQTALPSGLTKKQLQDEIRRLEEEEYKVDMKEIQDVAKKYADKHGKNLKRFLQDAAADLPNLRG